MRRKTKNLSEVQCSALNRNSNESGRLPRPEDGPTHSAQLLGVCSKYHAHAAVSVLRDSDCHVHTADCSEFAKGAKRTKKIEKSKKSENAEAGWESAFRCLCVLEPQQSAINRHIRAQWTFLRGIDDTCEMWMRSGAEIGRPDLRLRSSGTDCEWHL